MDAQPSNYFLLRKLHQLSGVIPLGLYMLVHLMINVYALQGAEAFDAKVELVESLPFLPLWEFGLIYLPLIYHAVFGVWVGMIARNNPLRFPYARNLNFTLQRLTGLFMFVWLAYHAVFMRFLGTPVGKTVAEAQRMGLDWHVASGYGKVVTHFQDPWIIAFYTVGLLCTAFHFANGLWEFLIDWGITVSMKSQQLASMAMVVVFLGVSFLSFGALAAFKFPDKFGFPPQMGVSPAAMGEFHGH